MNSTNSQNVAISTMENNTIDAYSIVPMTILIVRATTMAILSCLAILGNILVLATIIKFKKLQTPGNMFVANLAVSNLATGLLLSFLTWNVVIDR